MLDQLHVQLFPVIFDYLTQPELLSIIFLNSLIHEELIKYIEQFEDKYNTKTEIIIKRMNGLNQRNHIKYMVLFECMFPFKYLCRYIGKWWDNYEGRLYAICEQIWRYSYKFDKPAMIGYAKKYNVYKVDVGILSGALAAGNAVAIATAINDILFYHPNTIFIIAHRLHHCKDVETYKFVLSRFDANDISGLSYHICYYGDIKLIKYRSQDGITCSHCNHPIIGHLPAIPILSRHCSENNLKKIRQYSRDGLTCSYCNESISIHSTKNDTQ